MSVTSMGLMDEAWFEPTPRRRLNSAMPVARLMTAFSGATARDFAWPRVASVSAHATVGEAAHLMARHGLRQVQVRDAHGEVVGVLSASDLYRWVAGALESSDEAGAA
jgi:CBS domain-containing protein